MNLLTKYLETYFDEVTYKDFYRDIFPVGVLQCKGKDYYGDRKYNGIIVEVTDEKLNSGKPKVLRHTLTDDLEKLDEVVSRDNFCLMSPISYAGKTRDSSMARELYALAFDLDGIQTRIKDGEDETLNYTDEERALVMESIENSQIYKEHLDIIQNSDRINVFKNNTDQSYFSVAYIQKDSDGKIVKTLIFDVNEEYEVSGAFATIANGNNIVIEDYVNNSAQVYSVTRAADYYTLQCTSKKYHGTVRGDKNCEWAVGKACNFAMKFTGAGVIISKMVCYVGKIAICAEQPAGYTCEQWTRYNVCPF